MAGIQNGTVTLDRDGDWRGIANGNVIVRPGCRVHLHGIVNGDIIVEHGAEAVIHGMVNGEVIERGGRAIVRGMVNT